MGIYGQDWASYQTSQPDTSGLAFAFVKVTEGLGYTNPKWTSQRDHAKANGLVWGAYHYPHMGNDPHAEADRFLAQVAWQPGDLIVLDWEGYDAANTGVSRADQLTYKDAWLRYVKQQMPHNPVGMYCNVDYWERVDTTGYYADFLWIATADRAAGDPGIRADWLFHQYGGGDTDLDYCHLGSVDELHAWAMSFAGPTPAPAQEDDVALDQARSDQWNAMIWGLKNTTEQTLALVKAQGATIQTLATLLGAQHPGVDTAQVVAAVQQAIKDAVINVDVNVNNPTAH